jgi:hypothetical protein
MLNRYLNSANTQSIMNQSLIIVITLNKVKYVCFITYITLLSNYLRFILLDLCLVLLYYPFQTNLIYFVGGSGFCKSVLVWFVGMKITR